MSQGYSYSTTFTLSKAHLTQCYEQSVAVDVSIKKYQRAIVSLVFGICLLVFKLVGDYLAFFVIALGILEVFSTYYRKTWWLWRQMWGKSYLSEVTLLVDEIGIHNRSAHVDEAITWPSISAVEKTDLGLIVRHTKGASYLSNSCLDDTVVTYLLDKSSDSQVA